MAFVVVVASRKGGAGKSTVAANLATALLATGARVALIDADPQAWLDHALGALGGTGGMTTAALEEYAGAARASSTGIVAPGSPASAPTSASRRTQRPTSGTARTQQKAVPSSRPTCWNERP